MCDVTEQVPGAGEEPLGGADEGARWVSIAIIPVFAASSGYRDPPDDSC